ncbi:hypothetical protein [Pontimicrobium sp. MEBiC01747]|jgi:hypothetical protein
MKTICNQNPLKKITSIILVVVGLMLMTSCDALKTAVYDQYSYQKSVEIKVEASSLMDKAITPYADNKEEIEALNKEIQKIVEYEKNKPNNEITYAMWKILSNKEKNLLAGFFKRWEEKGQMSQFFVTEAKAQVLEAMDLLIQYEGKKDKVAKDRLLDIITSNN